MAKFELDEDLQKITLSRKKKRGDVKKLATILCAKKRDYAQVMTITSTITKTTAKREATPKEMAEAMHKQWRLQGNKESTNNKVEDDGHKTALADVNKNGAKCYECGLPHHKRK